MSSKKKKLEKGVWYEVATECGLWREPSKHSRTIAKIKPKELVMFLEYDNSSHYIVKVVFGSLVGWILVPSKYNEHHFFFRKASILC